ncbi:DM9 repeat-containing protein [Ferrovibrio sp.]|uniref:DM9 repeat-containing protein n=1 Tax=Ferrovibrio sp. TaxID=1917215 RepID=UPI000CC170DD|nr:DM9 repeat-containing protein [Ferrovibrio sp.]PJI39569.1 MAG: hypothetical protein CTR53_12150 [Ferrovibrio sp.]
MVGYKAVIAAALLVTGIAGVMQGATAQQQTPSADPRTWAPYTDGIASMTPYAWVNGVSPGDPRLAGAVIGGQVGAQAMMLCRARHQGGLHPGKVWAGKCNIGYGGRELAIADFDILTRSVPQQYATSFPDVWREPAGIDPRMSFVAGNEGAQAMRPCRAALQDGIHSGKEVAGKCNIGWGGKEITIEKYEVLVLPNLLAGGQVPPVAAQPVQRQATQQQSTQVQTSQFQQGVIVTPGKIETKPAADPQPQLVITNSGNLQVGDPSKLQLDQKPNVKVGGPVILNTPGASVTPAAQFSYPSNPVGSSPMCGGIVNGKPQPPCDPMGATYEGPARGSCPAGSFFDVGLWQCWSCPQGYERSTAAVDTARACARRDPNARGELGPARYMGPLCPPGSFHDPIRGGECWSCPSGYERTIAHIDAGDACVRPARDDLKSAIRQKRTIWPHECSSGQFHDGWDGGSCWSCPSGYNRTGNHINSGEACSRSLSAQIARASVVKRAQCEAGEIHDLKIPGQQDTRTGGGCYKCAEAWDRTVHDVTGPQACEKDPRMEFARATFQAALTCPSGQHFDLIGVSNAELSALRARNLVRGNPGAANSGTCWSCPTGAKRTVYSVKDANACSAPDGFRWSTAPYDEPGLFRLQGAEAATLEILRERNGIEIAIAELAKNTNTPVATVRREVWEEIARAPQDSAVLKAVLFAKLLDAIAQPSVATPAQKELLQSFGRYIVARRTYTAQDALLAYEAWAQADTYWRQQRNQTAGNMVALLDTGVAPPDFEEIGHVGLIVGMTASGVASTGYTMAMLGGAFTKLAPYATQVAKQSGIKFAQKVALKAGEDLTKVMVKNSTKAAIVTAKKAGTKATMAAMKMIASAGPQIIIFIATEIITAEFEKMESITQARPKLQTALATARQAPDFSRMTASEQGMGNVQGYWTLATGSETPPSAAGAAEIRAHAVAALNGTPVGQALQPESSSARGMCIGYAANYVGIRPCNEDSTQWIFVAQNGELRNGGLNACMDVAASGASPALQACDPRRATQQWSLQQDGRIRNQSTGTCLGIHGAASTTGAIITMANCAQGHVWKPKT